jgi:hypothetical protein
MWLSGHSQKTASEKADSYYLDFLFADLAAY